MPEAIGAPLFLLARFADFFQEVADIKLAIGEGRLGTMLSTPDEAPPSAPIDLAARVSARLAIALRNQIRDVARSGTAAECKTHRDAVYIMAALADELFILEIDWPGRHAWLSVLLEHRLFNTCDAGTRFFGITERLLQSRINDSLQVDLASVVLLALRLGFKGKYRGANGDDELLELSEQLFRLIQRERGAGTTGPAFPQALEQTAAGGKPARLAPLTPWFVGAQVMLAVYLVISSALWLALIQPFLQTVGSG